VGVVGDAGEFAQRLMDVFGPHLHALFLVRRIGPHLNSI